MISPFVNVDKGRYRHRGRVAKLARVSHDTIWKVKPGPRMSVRLFFRSELLSKSRLICRSVTPNRSPISSEDLATTSVYVLVAGQRLRAAIDLLDSPVQSRVG